MIHVFLATHGDLGRAMLETAAMISGGTTGIRCAGLYPGGGAEEIRAALREALVPLTGQDQLLCLTDIPGGTPARVAAALSLEDPRVHVVSGMNLGMLTETLLLRDSMEIGALKAHILSAAQTTISDLGELLRRQAG